MSEDLLDKHKNDHTWSEVVCLYSGLFDTQEEREDFIIDLAESNVLLAAECKTSSSEEQERLQLILSDKATSLLNIANISDANLLSAIFALSELNRFDTIFDYIAKIKGHKILLTRNLLLELPTTIEAKNVLLTALYSQPTIIIKILLESIERFEQEKIYLTQEDINKVFEILIKEKVKVIHVFSFLKIYADRIQNTDNYKDYAIQNLPNILGYNDLLNWLKLFNITLNTETLIKELCKSETPKALHNVLFLINNLEEKSQLVILKQMLGSSSNLIATALIYLIIHSNLRKYFDVQSYYYNVKIDSITIEKFYWFYRTFSKVHGKVKQEIIQSDLNKNINESIKVGDNLKCRLISKRIKYYLVQSVIFHEIDKVLKYLIPLPEAQSIVQSDVDGKKEIEAKVIYIDITENRIFLSIEQLERDTKELKFNQEYLYEINVGDTVMGTITYRYENKVHVKINGMGKRQKAIVLENSKNFEGVSKVIVRVERIQNQVIYLKVEEMLKNKDVIKPSTDSIRTDFVKLRDDNKIGDIQKILIIVNERFKCGSVFSLLNFYSSIGSITKSPITYLFPDKLWFINYLEKADYVKEVEGEKSYVFTKQLDTEIFNKINSTLELMGWRILSSFNNEVKKQIPIIHTKHNTLKHPNKISLNDTVIATITKITLFGLSLKIYGEHRKAIIPVTELTYKRLSNINDFEYNGEKLFIGQKLKAKVIGIDDKYGISLSIKQL